MSEKNATINLRLEKLRKIFAQALPSRLASIDLLWAKVKSEGINDSETAHELCRAVHTLAGSAGTFGQSQLGQVARLLEQTLDSVLKADGLVTAAAISDIDEQVLALKNSFFFHSVVKDDIVDSSVHFSNSMRFDVAILEDDVILAKEIAGQLAIYGYKVHVCINLDELEAAFKDHSFVAVLADVELAEGSLTSPKLANRLKAICLGNVTIMFISTRDDWAARLTAVRTGAMGYYKKPVDCGVLANRLSSLIIPQPSEKYRILIVEDQVELARHYAEILRRADMLVEILEHPGEILATINRFHPDLILMDLYMPDCTGLELTAIIRQIEAYQGIPIVFLSTEAVKENQHTAMFLGGDDFLQKPISNEDLVYAVSHRAERFKFLNELMVCDSLTGLLNHATLKTQLETMLARALRNATCLCFVMIDIDLFKSINDRFGHPKGDVVIRSLAHLLKKRLRAVDVVGRYGGEEFAVILPDTQPSDAFAIIDELRSNFEKITHYHEDKVFNATFSAGIAATPPFFSMQDLIDEADSAMYTAKYQGRNRVVMGKM